MNGFIKLHRRMLDWEWYRDSNTKCVFLHLLLSAAFTPGEWKGIQVGEGQAIIGTQKLAADLGLSRQQVRTALKKLTASGEITTQTTNRYTLVTIRHWRDFQQTGKPAGPPHRKKTTGPPEEGPAAELARALRR